MYALLSFQRGGLRRFATAASSTADSLTFKGAVYPFRWLRDSCQCPQCVHPSTRQKLHRTSDVPIDLKPATDAVEVVEDGVHVTWSPAHTSFYPSAFLQRYSSQAKLHDFHRDVDAVSWDKGQIQSNSDLFVKYLELRTPSGLLTALNQLSRYGLLFVTDVSPKETSNKECEARRLAELFSELRETLYGDLWDVINVRNSTNIAYTNLDLGLHMDLLYVHSVQ